MLQSVVKVIPHLFPQLTDMLVWPVYLSSLLRCLATLRAELLVHFVISLFKTCRTEELLVVYLVSLDGAGLGWTAVMLGCAGAPIIVIGEGMSTLGRHNSCKLTHRP